MAVTKCTELEITPNGETTRVVYNKKYNEFYVVKSNTFKVDVISANVAKLILKICKENSNVLK